MGDTQSAHQEDKEDAAAEGESGKVDDAQTEQNIEDKPLKNNGQISEINGKADGSIAEVNGHCDDVIDAEAILSSDEDGSETERPLKEEETPLNIEINENESPNEADANEDVPLEMIEMDAKQNDINESFKRFFRNIGLNLTVKKGSDEIATDVPDETNEGEPNRAEDVEDTTKETTSDNAEQNTDVNLAQETYDNDSTTCPTLTDVTSDVLENAEEKTEQTKEEVASDNVDAAMTSPVGEHAQQDATPEHSTSPCSPEEEVVVSPIKRFFTTGIFSGLRKKKKPAEDKTTDTEPEDKGGKEVNETREQTVQDKQQDIEEISSVVEAAAIETEHKENILKGEILSAVSAQVMDASTIDPSTIIVTEPEILNSQEKDKVQASPLKRLLTGSSLKKLSKKQRGRKSSDAKLSDSGEHVSDQLLSSTGSAENQKEEGCAQHSAEAVGEEDGTWASFKKLVTPKKRIKRSSLSNEETQIPGSVEEPKPSEGGQISDLSTEEGKKRKDSSVSWESVLCGSGRRRSRKTSDSEDETPQIDKQDGGSKHGTELALENSNEVDEMLAYSPKEAGSPSEDDGGSTWKSLKRLVTPKKKAKDEDESKDHVQSDSEVTQDESSFSIKKLLPGRKKRKSAEKQDQVSSDEADKDVASGDEDSETPAVVPLSEFDTVENEVHIQTQANIESHIPKEGDHELQQDLLDQMVEPVLPCDNLQTEVKKVQDNVVALENQASKTQATNEEPDDFTESISKQQLSDIPEEATPASATEEAARDDTIAEDLIEITSEAITAPEPLDITLADETEMISAVSQLSSESSKTSGNTTPVPAEYDFMETDVLLHQVVETISISPNTVPVCSNELRSERIVVSVSHQILETFVKEEPTILEIQQRLDATPINMGLNVEELDEINELAATTETESIFEVNDSYSTETVSEVHTEEFDTAEIAVDEVHEVNITHQEDSLKELESIDESHHLVKCPSEMNAAVSKDILPEGDEIVLDEGSLVKAHQAKTEPPKTDAQEADSAATVVDEIKDGAMEQEVQTVTEKEDQITYNITDQIQVTDKDQEIILEDIPAAETVTYELKEETVTLTEVIMEPEKEDEIVTDAKTGNVKVPEAFDTVQASTLDLEEGSVQSREEEVKSEDIPPTETVTEKPKQTEEHLTQVNVEPENKELKATEHVQEPEADQAHTFASEESSGQSLEKEVISEHIPEAETVTDEPILLTEEKLQPVEASETERAQEPGEVLKVVQALTLDSEGSVESLEKELITEDVPEAATVTDEPKKETILLTEVKLEPVEAAKTEHVQEPELLPTTQVATLDSEVGSCLSLEKEVISEDIPAVETVTDEPKQETEVRVEPEEKLPMDAAKTQHVQEPEGISGQSLEKEVISEDVPEAETITDGPKEETILLTEETLEPVEASQTEYVQEPGEVLEVVQAPTLDSEESSVQSLEKVLISEDVPETANVTGEPKEEPIPLTEEKFQSVEASETEHVQESEEGSGQPLEKEIITEDVPEAATVTDEPKEETILLTEDKLEPVDASKTERVQEPELFQAVQGAIINSEAGSCLSLEKEVISEDIPAVETVTDEPKQETEVSVEPEEKLPMDAGKTQHVQEPEGVSGQSLEKEVISEDVPEAETITDGPKEETILLTEEKLEPAEASQTEHVQEPELLPTTQVATLESEVGSSLSLEKEVISEDIPAVEIVTDEPKQETEVRVEPEELLPMEVAKTEHDKEPEGVSGQSLEKEVISEDVPEAATITDGPKEETILLTEKKLEPVEASQTEHVQEPGEVLEVVQAPTLDSEESSVQSLEKVLISEDVPETAKVTGEPKEEPIPLTEEKLQPVEASETEHVQEPEEGSGQPLEKEIITEDIKEAATVTDEPKEETILLTEDKLEPVEASQTEHVQEPEEGSGQSLEEEVISEDVPEITVTGELKGETILLTEENLEPVEASETEHVQEPEEVSGQSHEEEVISEDIPEAATITDGPKEETILLTEVKFEPMDASKTERVQEPELFQAVQGAIINSEAGSCLSLERKVISEDIPAVETVTDEPKQETEVRAVPEEKLPMDAAKTQHVQEPEEGSGQSLEEEVISEDVPEATVTDKLKGETILLTEENLEPVEVSETEHVQEPEEGSGQSLEKELITEDVPEEPKEETIFLTEDKLEPVEASQTQHVQEPEGVSGQSLEEEVISEDVPEAKVTGELKGETILLTEVKFEPVEASQTEHVQEPGEVLEAGQAPTLDSEESSVQSFEKELISEDLPESSVQSLGKEVTSVDVPEAAIVTDEPKEKIPLTEETLKPVDASKTEHVQEPEVIQAIQAATFDSGVDSLILLKKEVISEDIPAVETVTNEPKQETEVRAEPKEKLPMEAAKTEHVKEPEVLLSNVKLRKGTSLYVHVVTESIERDSAKELEKQILLKPDNVNVSIDEIESEVVAQLDHSLEITEDQKTVSITQDLDVEQEDRIPEDELQTLTAVCVSSVNEEGNNVLVLEKTVFTEETPAPCVDNAAVTNKLKHEVHISTVQVSVEVEKEREIKTAAVEHAVTAQVVTCNQLVKDDVAETAEEGSVVVMMHVPSVEFEDNHRVQVEVGDVNIKSAETIVDTVQEVGVTEAKEVIYVYQETLKKVHNLPVTPEINKELINEENNVTIQEVIQHVNENLPEIVPESLVDNLEQEVIKQPDAVTEVSEMVESDTNEVEDQKVMEDNIATIRERQDEVPAVISDVSATEQQVSKDLMQTADIPGRLDVSIHDHKVDLEETKAKQEKSEAGEVKSSSEELDVKTINEEAQITHIAQSPIVTLSNTNLVAPQNTGIISSIGNVESPSSLSFEFKLNIQFGQAKAASPLSTTEKNEPVQKTEVSEVRVQAVEVVEPVKPINPTQRAESQTQTELTEVAVQATEPVANLDSTERAVITTQPVLLDIGIQAMKTVEPVEHIKSTERVTSSVQATETIKPVKQAEKGDVFLSQPVLSEVCEQETKAETPVKQKEEENDQDVWMDAEEDISTQEETEVSLHKVEESLELQPESKQVEKAGLEDEVEMAPNSKTEEEESQQKMHKAVETCEIESDGEDFAVALEHCETQTASITMMEWN